MEIASLRPGISTRHIKNYNNECTIQTIEKFRSLKQRFSCNFLEEQVKFNIWLGINLNCVLLEPWSDPFYLFSPEMVGPLLQNLSLIRE